MIKRIPSLNKSEMKIENFCDMMLTDYSGAKIERSRRRRKIYPHLLKALDIFSPDQVCATDMTYIMLKRSIR